MKKICQIYLPAIARTYGNNALRVVSHMFLALQKKYGFAGVYLIGLWQDGSYDNGFDVVEYVVNPQFGKEEELESLLGLAHTMGMEVGVDVVPHHTSYRSVLAQNCINDVPGYEDCLYVVSRKEADQLAEAGVPSFFGDRPYSGFGDKYVRSTFADFHQLDLNWESEKVREYFAKVFQHLKVIGVDFVRVDCGMMLLEDVSKASKENPFACMRPKASVEAVRAVAGGMKLFFEWFDPDSSDIFDDMPECYALDCSYVVTHQQPLDWSGHKKLIPLLGGHDQMTVADRGINVYEATRKLENSGAEYGFSDIQTELGIKTNPNILPGDKHYDADIDNPNQRYRARRAIGSVLIDFMT